jgi:hypothetical protein
MRSFTKCFRVVKSSKMRWAGHAVCIEEMRNTFIILVGKPEGKRLLGRSKRRWNGNIRLERGWEGVDWIHLAQDRDQWRLL